MAITRCPECGREVSTLAHSCPHCGVPIKNYIRRFFFDDEEPNNAQSDPTSSPKSASGKQKGAHGTQGDASGKQKGAHGTQGDANGSQKGANGSRGGANSQEEDEYIPQKTEYERKLDALIQQEVAHREKLKERLRRINAYKKRRENRKKIIFFTAYMLGMMLIIVGGSYVFKNMRDSRHEREDYNLLMDNFSIEDAKTFLLKYPSTSHAEEIRNEIGRYERYKQEWNLIANSTNINDFATFRSRFPNSPFDQLAYDKIDSLDWVSAIRDGSEEALQNYLSVHPEGKYTNQAQIAKIAILDAKPSEQEQNTASTNLTRYFNALSDNSKEALTDITTEAVYEKSCEFIDKHNLTEIINYNISSPIRVEKKQSAYGQNYIATCSVNRVSTDAEGKTTTTNFTARATLNQQMQIASINLHAFAK